uniref:Uncharacterized protein n=1 Tax=Phytophthora ramorum TaxID=164328 RepID=H3H4K8_PHYRM
MSVGSPNTSATHVARADCPHLSEPEWEALRRLSTVIGEAAVATMLRTLSPTEQHGVALGFIVKEQRETAARTSVSPSATPRVESLKLHVSSYVGREGEPLLRWLVEVDTAIAARRIVDPLSKVAFAMSCLGGRARSWAYGRRLTDPTCFSTYEEFKEELKLAFEPRQNEFRSRAEFLDLQQGKHDVHAYAQRARYLVSNIATNPIDEATKVVTFMKGLRDGPVKTYLFREYPNTLEAAIALAMQEEFSLRHAKPHVNAPRLMPRPVVRPSGGPEPMDLSSATAAGSQQRRGSTNGPAGAGRPAGDAIERVDIGHAAMKIAAPSESQSHCKKQDDKPNLVILKSLPRLDFEEVETPRSLLEVRLATGVVGRTEKRIVRVRFSYQEKEFVDELIVLELDDKFDMVLGMPWLARHDLVIDWTKRTIICILSDVERMTCEAEELNQLISEGADALSAKSKKERFDEQGWDSLKASPFYKVLREYKDVLPDDIPAELPQDKGVQHEIDLVPGTKYCVTRQWPLPREQVKAIDDFFESRRNAGQVRESKSPHSAPTFCVKKPQGGWRIVHAYNKLNDATVPAQTPIPRKDVIIDSMTSSTIFSTLDLRDGSYQILMRENDIPLTAVSTPSGMLWEWLVMPQGLKNVQQHKLYANLKKCIFGAAEILSRGEERRTP